MFSRFLKLFSFSYSCFLAQSKFWDQWGIQAEEGPVPSVPWPHLHLVNSLGSPAHWVRVKSTSHPSSAGLTPSPSFLLAKLWTSSISGHRNNFSFSHFWKLQKPQILSFSYRRWCHWILGVKIGIVESNDLSALENRVYYMTWCFQSWVLLGWVK